MATPALRAPDGWDFHADGHAAAAQRNARREQSLAESRRWLVAGDTALTMAMKRGGEQGALARLAAARPAQRLYLVRFTDGSGATPLHRAAEFGFVDLCKALLQAGADVDALDTAGLCALEYAAKEGHTACADVLVAAGSLPDAPRARAALQALAQAPWRLLRAPLGRPRKHTVEQLVHRVRRLIQPHFNVNHMLDDIYFHTTRRLLERLAPLDAPGADVTLQLCAADEANTTLPYWVDLYSQWQSPNLPTDKMDIQRAAHAATVAMALAGALAEVPDAPPLDTLHVRGFPLPVKTAVAQRCLSPDLPNLNALISGAMASLGDAMAQPGAPRHVTLELVQPAPGLVMKLETGAALARLPAAAASALAGAVRAAWQHNGALRSLTLSLPPGMRLCPQQRALLSQPQDDAVAALLLGMVHKRCGEHSPLRMLDANLLRRLLRDCTVAVRVVETAAV